MANPTGSKTKYAPSPGPGTIKTARVGRFIRSAMIGAEKWSPPLFARRKEETEFGLYATASKPNRRRLGETRAAAGLFSVEIRSTNIETRNKSQIRQE